MYSRSIKLSSGNLTIPKDQWVMGIPTNEIPYIIRIGAYLKYISIAEDVQFVLADDKITASVSAILSGENAGPLT